MMMWDLFAKYKRRTVLPSAILAIDYQWVADDLDDAVIRWGQFVEQECRKAYERVVDQWQEVVKGRQQRYANLRGAGRHRVHYPSFPKDRARDASECRWYELVRCVRRKKLAGRFKKPSKGDLMPRPTAILTWEQPLTGDPEKDETWNETARIVYEEPIGA